MTEREQNRSAHPEFAEAVDFLRSRGATITAAWIEDDEGVVIAGRRPQSVMHEFWIDSEKLEHMRRDFATPQKAPRSKR